MGSMVDRAHPLYSNLPELALPRVRRETGHDASDWRPKVSCVNFWTARAMTIASSKRIRAAVDLLIAERDAIG
jgi:hypothetical protein